MDSSINTIGNVKYQNIRNSSANMQMIRVKLALVIESLPKLANIRSSQLFYNNMASAAIAIMISLGFARCI